MPSVIEKAKRIKLLMLDVDGVLTDGKIYFSDEGSETKAFNSRDGLGIKLLQQSGVMVAVNTARNSAVVTRRMTELQVRYVFQNQSDKKIAYQTIKKELQLKDEHIAYMGDDLTDLPLIRCAGLGITVPQASEIIHYYADWSTQHAGGQGAVREVCELIMKAHNTFNSVVKQFL